MMKFIENVDKDRFDAFAFENELNHYSKTSYFIDFKKPEYYAGDLLGVEDENGNLIASAVMLHKKTKMPIGQYSYCQYGFDLDYEETELVQYFITELKEYAKKKGSFFLRIDPNITRLEHEKNGIVKEDGFNHEYITEIFKQCGYTHLGYNYGYSGNWMSRYTYRLSLDQPFNKVLKGIKRCSQYTNKNEQRAVKVHKATMDELDVLVMGQEDLSHKLGFEAYGIEYFKKLWKCYEPFVHYYVVTTNYHEAKMNLLKLIEEEENRASQIKDDKKKEPVLKSIVAMKKEVAQIDEGGLDIDKEIPLGAKFIIMQGVNVWNVNMYTIKTLMNFRGAFALHRYAIEDLYNQGAKTYDFEGISGSLDPKDEYYGQQDFKKSFGGDFLEFLGEFDAILDDKKYELWKKSDHFYRRVRRKLRYIVNKK